jgi:hypothetical protein
MAIRTRWRGINFDHCDCLPSTVYRLPPKNAVVGSQSAVNDFLNNYTRSALLLLLLRRRFAPKKPPVSCARPAPRVSLVSSAGKSQFPRPPSAPV